MTSAKVNLDIKNKDGDTSANANLVNKNVAPQIIVTKKSALSAFQDFKFFLIDIYQK